MLIFITAYRCLLVNGGKAFNGMTVCQKSVTDYAFFRGFGRPKLLEIRDLVFVLLISPRALLRP